MEDIRQIPIDQVYPPLWNSRIAREGDSERLAELAESIKAQGQLEPIEVQEEVDQESGEARYRIVFGWRRYSAITMLKGDSILARVLPAGSEVDQVIRNITENVQRENLTPFEEARACLKLRELGLKPKDIAARVGFSDKKVGNLCQTYKGLPAPILADWERNVPAVNVQFMRELANPKHYPTEDDQTRAWEERKRAVAKMEEAGVKRVSAKRKRETKVEEVRKIELVQVAITHALKFLNSKKAPKKIGGTPQWAHDLLKYVIGTRATPPAGIPVPEIEVES